MSDTDPIVCSEAFWVPSTGRESLGYCVEHPELAAWPCHWSDLRAERDALAARLAAVEALADEWEREAREQSIVGGESPRPADYSEGYYVGTMRTRAAHAAHLRAALATGTDQ